MGQNKWIPLAVGAAGLLVLKRTGVLGFIPGMGRRKATRPTFDDSAEEEGLTPGRHGRRNKRLTSEEKLLVAFDHVDRSYKELIKAQPRHNGVSIACPKNDGNSQSMM